MKAKEIKKGVWYWTTTHGLAECVEELPKGTKRSARFRVVWPVEGVRLLKPGQLYRLAEEVEVEIFTGKTLEAETP